MVNSASSPFLEHQPVGVSTDPSQWRAAAATAVVAAGCAPSIHNTQPWSWNLQGAVLQLRADRARQLQSADQDGQSLLVSCGAAVELTKIALAADGWRVETRLMPGPGDPDLLASFHLIYRGRPDGPAAQQLHAAKLRRSDRRVYGREPVAPAVVHRLCMAARAPAVRAHVPQHVDEIRDLAVAISRADRSEGDNPAYLAELHEWLRRDPMTPDGALGSAVPADSDDVPSHADIPLQDYVTGLPGAQLICSAADERQLIAVIITQGDEPVERLRAGQSMMRLMIQAELDGIASCALSQSVDLPLFQRQLMGLTSSTGYPQTMLRLGKKALSMPPPFTGRRRVDELLIVRADGNRLS